MEALRRVLHYSTVLFLIGISDQLYAAADTFIDFDATAGLDDNVTRAIEDRDIDHDTFISAGASLGHEYWESGQSSIVLNVGLSASKFFEYDGLSHIDARAGATFTHGFYAGFGAPWMSVHASYTFSEFESFLRDSDIYFTEVTLGKRIDDRTDVRTAVSYKKRESEGKAFDTENASWFINVDWTLMKKTVLYTTYKIQKGDVFSTASIATASSSGPYEIGLLISSGTPVVDEDDVFDDMLTYRLEATTQIVTIGLNLARNLHSSYDISLRYLESEADLSDRLRYEDLTLRLTYFYRYGL